MPPKKDTADGGAVKSQLEDFKDSETKLLAAAFLSSIGPDKYDYDLMAKLTGNTNGSLKKMWPPIKKKAIEAYPSFATFISNTSDKITAASGEAKPAPKPAARRKRKVADAEVDADSDSKDVEPKFTGTKSNKTDSAGTKSDGKAETKKKAPPAKKGRATKKPKVEVRDEEDSANGGDGLGTKESEDEA